MTIDRAKEFGGHKDTQQMLDTLKKMLTTIGVISLSNAECERGFRTINLIRND